MMSKKINQSDVRWFSLPRRITEKLSFSKNPKLLRGKEVIIMIIVVNVVITIIIIIIINFYSTHVKTPCTEVTTVWINVHI